MKKKKGIEIKINFSEKWFYTLIVIGVLAIVGIGVYAYGTSEPSTFGHSLGEIATCNEGETLQVVGGEWTCVNGMIFEEKPIFNNGITLGSFSGVGNHDAWYDALSPTLQNIGDVTLMGGWVTISSSTHSPVFARRTGGSTIRIDFITGGMTISHVTVNDGSTMPLTTNSNVYWIGQ